MDAVGAEHLRVRVGCGIPIHQHHIVWMCGRIVGKHLVGRWNPRTVSVGIDQYQHAVGADHITNLVQLIRGDCRIGAKADQHPLPQTAGGQSVADEFGGDHDGAGNARVGLNAGEDFRKAL